MSEFTEAELFQALQDKIYLLQAEEAALKEPLESTFLSDIQPIEEHFTVITAEAQSRARAALEPMKRGLDQNAAKIQRAAMKRIDKLVKAYHDFQCQVERQFYLDPIVASAVIEKEEKIAPLKALYEEALREIGDQIDVKIAEAQAEYDSKVIPKTE
jgi:hypothetical protein